MKFVYKGKYSGDEATLPQREHPEGYVPYKEPQDMKKMALVLNVAALLIIVLGGVVLFWRLGMGFQQLLEDDPSLFLWGYGGLLVSLVAVVPHEYLHAICFREEVEMYQNLRQGMLFVVGTEDMSKARFIFMSMLPNLVFGFIPFAIFLINPSLIFFGTLGLFSIGGGAGDYMNVLNTILQVPKGATVYMSGMHSFWYKKG